MTVVYTYLASDNARNRRRAKRAAERNTSVTGCTDRVLKAITQAPDWRVRPEPEVTVNRENPKYRKVCNEVGRQIHAVQKQRGRSIPAYYD